MLNDNRDIPVVAQKRKPVKVTAKFQEIEEIIIMYIKKMRERGLPKSEKAYCVIWLAKNRKSGTLKDSVLPKDE